MFLLKECGGGGRIFRFQHRLGFPSLSSQSGFVFFCEKGAVTVTQLKGYRSTCLILGGRVGRFNPLARVLAPDCNRKQPPCGCPSMVNPYKDRFPLGGVMFQGHAKEALLQNCFQALLQE